MSKDIYQLDNYTIPRGLMFIDLLDANDNTTGEIDLGNVVSAALTGGSTNLTHQTSRAGLNEQDRDVVTGVSRSQSVTLDSINMQNLSLFLMADLSVVTQTSTPVLNEPITVQLGRTYQLGQTGTNFMGVRNVSAVVVTDVPGTTTYVLGVDYDEDLVNGRVRIRTLAEGCTITGGQVVHVDYTPAAETRNQMVAASAPKTVAIRVVENNPEGGNKMHYIPKAVMRPTGDMNLINTEDAWAQLPFEIGIQKKTPTTAAVIIEDAA